MKHRLQNREWELEDLKHQVLSGHMWGHVFHATRLLLANALLTLVAQTRLKTRRKRFVRF